MKKEIVYTDNYLLVVDNLSRPAKEGETFLSKEGFIHTNTGYNYGDKLIIAHLPLSDAPMLEGVPLLPSFRCGQQDDILLIGMQCRSEGMITSVNSFIVGYNKAKEKYKYTEKDLKLAMNYGYVQGDTGFIGVANLDDLLDLILRKIKKPSRPTHFECEMENCDKCVYVQGGNLSSDCCNQLKPKTITNSQGQVELVGKYLNL